MFLAKIEARKKRCPFNVVKCCIEEGCMAWVQEVAPFAVATLNASIANKLYDVAGNAIIFPEPPDEPIPGEPVTPEYNAALAKWLENAEKIAKIWYPLYSLEDKLEGAILDHVYVDDTDNLDIVAVIKVPNPKQSQLGYCGRIYPPASE